MSQQQYGIDTALRRIAPLDGLAKVESALVSLQAKGARDAATVDSLEFELKTLMSELQRREREITAAHAHHAHQRESWEAAQALAQAPLQRQIAQLQQQLSRAVADGEAAVTVAVQRGAELDAHRREKAVTETLAQETRQALAAMQQREQALRSELAQQTVELDRAREATAAEIVAREALAAQLKEASQRAQDAAAASAHMQASVTALEARLRSLQALYDQQSETCSQLRRDQAKDRAAMESLRDDSVCVAQAYEQLKHNHGVLSERVARAQQLADLQTAQQSRSDAELTRLHSLITRQDAELARLRLPLRDFAGVVDYHSPPRPSPWSHDESSSVRSEPRHSGASAVCRALSLSPPPGEPRPSSLQSPQSLTSSTGASPARPLVTQVYSPATSAALGKHGQPLAHADEEGAAAADLTTKLQQLLRESRAMTRQLENQ